MASIALRHKSRHLILKSQPTLFNSSRLYSSSSSSSSNNDNDSNHQQQQSSNPTQANDETQKNPSPNPKLDFLLSDLFKDKKKKIKDNKRKETENSAEGTRRLDYGELRNSIDSIRLKLKTDPTRRK